MALQISYRGLRLGSDLEITLYWFPREPDRPADYVARVLGAERTPLPRDVDVSGTPEEIASWTTAVAVFVEHIAREQEELRKAQRRIRRWAVTERRKRAKFDDAHRSFEERVRPAAAAYQPVRDVIEARLAEQEAQAREASRRVFQEQERRRAEAVARFREWERRQEVADRPLPGGLSPRQMAARGDAPTSWPPEVQAAAGDLAGWWAGVQASVRNRQARAQAVRKVVEAITRTAAALEAAGRPGISTIKGNPDEVLCGWWIRIDWSDLPDTTRLRTPPALPPGFREETIWQYRLSLPSDQIFTVNRSGEFGFASELKLRGPGGTATRTSGSKRASNDSQKA
ncbi:hypothetical protein GPZ77_33460 [Streptomyces sp. QHH-9511]|uniref:hypothetical protein n=1 Tax=Streptomyces sp. QHH-9511 TaxID=2684468 RepID=UPI001318E493|nr:hypothetical protein [Streptomyces sp. QHH-9511]QGZ52565.1 hypothetical protein GPZ77_33460 [Streptomyces sp. QHH-9511]